MGERLRGTFLLSIMAALPARSQAIDPMRVRFSSVEVPPQSIRLDSIRGQLRHYSGELTYDLAADYDSVPVHAYFEEVPAPKVPLFQDEGAGRARFRPIDSACSGDIGWVKPGRARKLRWRHATAEPRNHCRIKVGLANLGYMMTGDTLSAGGVSTRSEYAYNQLGLPVRRKIFSGQAPPEIREYAYNRCGQPLFIPPHTWYRYDSLCRRIYFQQGQGHTLQAILGYAYDSLSRATEIRHLPPGFPMEAPGPPFNRETFRFDGENRIVYREIKVVAEEFSCNPRFRFEGVDKATTWYYQDNLGQKVDSTVREYHDSAQASPLLIRWIEVNRRKRDSVPVSRLESQTGFDASPGSCFAPEYDQQTLFEYQHDARGQVERTIRKLKPAGAAVFAPVDTLCQGREYDASGRVLRSYFGCRDTVGQAWTYDAHGFVTSHRQGPDSRSGYGWTLHDLDTLEAFAPR